MLARRRWDIFLNKSPLAELVWATRFWTDDYLRAE